MHQSHRSSSLASGSDKGYKDMCIVQNHHQDKQRMNSGAVVGVRAGSRHVRVHVGYGTGLQSDLHITWQCV